MGFFCSTRGSVHVFTLLPVSVSGSSLAGLELPLRRVNRASALFGEPSTKGNQKQNTDCGFCFIFLSFIFFHLVGEGQCAFVSVKEANFGKYSDDKATVSFSAFAAAVYVLMWNRVSLVHVLFLSKKILRMLMQTKLLPRYSCKHLHLKTASEPLCQEV